MKVILIILFIISYIGLKAQFHPDSIPELPSYPAYMELEKAYTYTDSLQTVSLTFNLLKDSIDYNLSYIENDSLINKLGKAPKTMIGLEFLFNNYGEQEAYVTYYEYTLSEDLIVDIQIPDEHEIHLQVLSLDKFWVLKLIE